MEGSGFSSGCVVHYDVHGELYCGLLHCSCSVFDKSPKLFCYIIISPNNWDLTCPCGSSILGHSANE